MYAGEVDGISFSFALLSNSTILFSRSATCRLSASINSSLLSNDIIESVVYCDIVGVMCCVCCDGSENWLTLVVPVRHRVIESKLNETFHFSCSAPSTTGDSSEVCSSIVRLSCWSCRSCRSLYLNAPVARRDATQNPAAALYPTL
jgi:hypothetical protein